MPLDSRLQNPRAMFIGTGSYSFVEDAVSAADAARKPAEDFGNIKAFSFGSQPDKEAVEVSAEGVRVVGRNIPTLLKLGYVLKSNEMSPRNLTHIYSGSAGTPFTQAAQAAVVGATFLFSATPAVLDRWYDLWVGTTRIRNITSVTIPTLTEDVDFVLDKLCGRIRFITAQAVDRVPTITAPAITSASDGYLGVVNPLDAPIKRGYGRLIVRDKDKKNPLAFEHDWHECEITLESVAEVGKSVPDIGLMVTVLANVGKVYHRF